jgi:hypothetical protein
VTSFDPGAPLDRLAAGPPPQELIAEMQRLQARLARSNNIAAVTLIVATLCMAIARYV